MSDIAGAQPDAVLTAILLAAVEFTAAQAGWLVTGTETDERLAVMAVAGAASAELVGTIIDGGTGAAAYVLASGQPLALASRGRDPRRSGGLAQALGREPGSVMCVPCEADDDVVGAIELIDKIGGTGFSFDDVELATVLARIAGVALTTTGRAPTSAAPSVADLARELAGIAADQPDRYPAVAAVVAAIEGPG